MVTTKARLLVTLSVDLRLEADRKTRSTVDGPRQTSSLTCDVCGVLDAAADRRRREAGRELCGDGEEWFGKRLVRLIRAGRYQPGQSAASLLLARQRTSLVCFNVSSEVKALS
eukprot:7958112-Pyramimonas_sp.AAC.1